MEWRHPDPSPSYENPPDRETKHQTMSGDRGELREGKLGAQGRQMDVKRSKTPEDDRELGSGQVCQSGGRTVTGHGGRCRHLAWVA